MTDVSMIRKSHKFDTKFDSKCKTNSWGFCKILQIYINYYGMKNQSLRRSRPTPFSNDFFTFYFFMGLRFVGESVVCCNLVAVIDHEQTLQSNRLVGNI